MTAKWRAQAAGARIATRALLISGQEDASSKWRASQSPVLERSTSQRQSAASQEMGFGRSGASDVDRADAHERLEGIRQPTRALAAHLEALPPAAVRVCTVCVQVQTRDLCAPAVPWHGPSVPVGPCVVHALV